MNGVSVIFDDCISKNVVGHVPFNWSKLAAKFLQFPNHHIHVVVTDTRVNRSTEFGLEIPLDYIFYEDSGITNSYKKASKTVDNSLDVKGEKVVKYKHLKIE